MFELGDFFLSIESKGLQFDHCNLPLTGHLIRIFPKGLCQLPRMSSLAHTCLHAHGTQADCQELSFGEPVSIIKLLIISEPAFPSPLTALSFSVF